MAKTGMLESISAALQRTWWVPRQTRLARQWWLLWPLSWCYRGLFALKAQAIATQRLPVPVVVVGNLIVGGAGKTPTVIALVHALAAAGWRPGVISRGYGSAGDAARPVTIDSVAEDVGDEPALIARVTGVPVWVGARRVDVARRLCAAHLHVDVLISDDGLQHRALPRQLEVLVFDERGIGNGHLLPAGPLREPMWTTLTPRTKVLYNAAKPTTVLPGFVIERRLRDAVPLAAWARGERVGALPLAQLATRACWAAAGIATPERFFTMLDAAGLNLTRLPLPDHHVYTQLPWPADASDVLVTEKDAVKLQRLDLADSTTRIWVVGLDFVLPQDFLRWVQQGLAPTDHHDARPPPA